jgi:predicted aspartyl protease
MSDAVSSPRFPYLLIHVRIRQPSSSADQAVDLEALVDTGFDGGVVLPTDVIDPSLTPVRHLPWSLADDTEILAPAFFGLVTIGAFPPVPTVVIPLGDEAMVGRHVTNNFRVVFDHGTEVIVEP